MEPRQPDLIDVWEEKGDFVCPYLNLMNRHRNDIVSCVG